MCDFCFDNVAHKFMIYDESFQFLIIGITIKRGKAHRKISEICQPGNYKECFCASECINLNARLYFIQGRL